jgi:hypothetical protein
MTSLRQSIDDAVVSAFEITLTICAAISMIVVMAMVIYGIQIALMGCE